MKSRAAIAWEAGKPLEIDNVELELFKELIANKNVLAKIEKTNAPK